MCIRDSPPTGLPVAPAGGPPWAAEVQHALGVVRTFWERRLAEGVRPGQTWSNLTNPILWVLSVGARVPLSQLAAELRWPSGPTEALFDHLEATWTRQGPQALAATLMATYAGVAPRRAPAPPFRVHPSECSGGGHGWASGSAVSAGVDGAVGGGDSGP
eukprot:4395570-Alexandrium_andersonii.AAC.1